MSCRLIVFVDHEIGYRLLEKMMLFKSTSSFELLAVVTTYDNDKMWWPSVSDLCKKNNIPLHIYLEPFNLTLEYTNVDWYFLLSWKYIISSQLFNHPKNGAINLHYSLLPEYRGVYPVNWAIIEGREETGITYHLVSEGVDKGDIICQKKTSIFLYDTARTLQLRLDDLAFELFDEMIEWVTNGGGFLGVSLLQQEALGSYKSRSDFVESNELDLYREYRVIDFINLLRGKTFMPFSKNLYFNDPATGKKIFINVCLEIHE